jgi:UbiD family decarboxylase
MQVEQEVRGDKDEDAEDILYDDLMEAKVASSITSTPTTHHNKNNASTVAISRHHHPKSFTQQVEELKSQVDSIQSENQRLKRNIGTLFRTARSELQRKDAEIARLTDALDRAQHKPSQQQQNR